MFHSFRWGWLIACIVLSAVASRSRAADFDKFLPKETDVVMSINVRQMLDSPIGKKYAADLVKSMLANNKQTQKTLKALGLDPLSDFSRMSMGIGLEDLSSPKAVIAIEGKFDVKKMSDLLDGLAKDEPTQFAVDKVDGKTVYKVSTPDQPVPMYAAPVNSTLLVFATSKEQLAAAFDAAKGSRKAEIKKELADLLSKANGASSVYIVAHTKGRLDALPLPTAEMRKLVEQIYSITADLKVDKDVQIELAIGASGEDEAKKLRELVDGGIGLAKIQVKVALAQQPELQPLIDVVNKMTVIQKAKAVIIDAKLSGDSLEKMLAK